jgi:hypothetical protein
MRSLLGLAAVCLTTFVVGASALSAAQQSVTVGPIPARIPVLTNAAVLASVVRLEPTLHEAEVRVSCGWHYAPRTRVRRKLWKVSLRDLALEWESNPANPSEGHVVAVSLARWERRVEGRGWNGTLRLRRSGGSLSDGPTTDICAGVLG